MSQLQVNRINDASGGVLAPISSVFRNRIINGAMTVAQRATSATITAGSTIAAGYSTVDRFYVYCTGANVTAAQVAGSGSVQNRLQITGAASVTAIGVGQRIERNNSSDLAGHTCSLSVDLANSLLTTVTWTAFYANTNDTFGTLASPTRTQIATGTFTVNSTVTNYNAQIAIPAAATTGIEIVFTVGAQTSGTWTIGNVQLEKGSTATSFEYKHFGQELALCQRYFYRSQIASYGFPCPSTGGYAFNQRSDFKVTMRTDATVVASYSSNTNVASFNASTRTTDFFTDQIVGSALGNSVWAQSFTASAEL
jgi:hypothetical protein